MKKFKLNANTSIVGYAMLCAVFCGCDSTPIINGNKPFIVNQIDELNNGMCEYYGNNDARWDGNGFSGRPSIVLPKKLYNIGDTVRWQK